MEEILKLREIQPRDFLREQLKVNARTDGRTLHEYRPTTIVKGILRDTAGSALVRSGTTKILAASTLEVGRPSASAPQDGEVEINLSLGPTCVAVAGVADSGGDIDVPSVGSFVGRTIRASGAIDPAGLCIEAGRSAWKVRVDVLVLDCGGNLADAAFVAAVAALSDTKIPEDIVVSEEDGSVAIKAESATRPLVLRTLPVPLTVGIFDGQFLVDPLNDEEALISSFVTVVANSKGQIFSVCKPGGAAISPQKLALCMSVGIERAKEVEGAILGDKIMSR
mmetsp:Transcript_12726/g.28089  ORF Transcript_12726/g.28089 Transcript_12726/m.28089 type:complete len:280 (-) Transcript_12726:1105-1944(-)